MTFDTAAPTLPWNNRLLDRIGAPIVALLTDLLMSPAPGPNVQAALSHGLLDGVLQQELHTAAMQWMSLGKKDDKDEYFLQTHNSHNNHNVQIGGGGWDFVHVLCLALTIIAAKSQHNSKDPVVPVIADVQNVQNGNDETYYSELHKMVALLQQYRPIFSYTAMTLEHVEKLHAQSVLLRSCLETIQDNTNQVVPTSMFSDFCVWACTHHHHENPEVGLSHMFHSVLNALGGRSGDSEDDGDNNHDTVLGAWTMDDLFQEYESNQQLAPHGATRLLVQELVVACTHYLDHENRFRNNISASSSRSIAARTIVGQCLLFATHVALLSLHTALLPPPPQLLDHHHQNRVDLLLLLLLTPDELRQVVKRTRMVISTVDTFLVKKNLDRSVQAISTYTKSKVVQKLLTYYQSQ